MSQESKASSQRTPRYTENTIHSMPVPNVLLPLFPLDLVLLPGTPLPLHIFEPRYKELIRTCLGERTKFGVIRAAEGGIVRVGCSAEIVDVVRTYPDGRMDILTMGRQRFAVHDVDQDSEYLRADV